MSRLPRAVLLAGLAGLALGVPAAAGGGKLELTETGFVETDPSRLRSIADERIALALADGLTVLDGATGRAAPGVAERWEPAADGLSWTFHLRSDAVWSDGKPVTAKDFVFAWARILDPANTPAQAHLFRPIRGWAAILDANGAMTAMDVASKALKELGEANPGGIPGDQIARLIDESGVRPYAERIPSREVRKLLKWGSDPFSAEDAAAAREAIRVEKRKHKEVLTKGLDEFGKTFGAIPKDDRTLVVETEGWRPYLPELVARGAFVPLREDVLAANRDATFDTSGFVGNGPFLLRGRGSRPVAGSRTSDSAVHLVRNQGYKGPAAAQVDELFCWTDLGDVEELQRFQGKQVQWVANPARHRAKDVEKLPAFRSSPRQSVLYLKFRCDRKPFDKVEARRAFAFTADRSKLVKACWPVADPADRIVPPGIRGVLPGPKAPVGDVAVAKKAVQATGVKPPDWPWIELFYANDDDQRGVADALVETWKKALEIESSAHEDTGVETVALQGGKFSLVMEEVRGDWDDPSAYLERFLSTDPRSMTGWKDEAFDAMVLGARDPVAFAAAPEKALAGAQDAAGLQAKIAAVKGGSPEAREALRQALYAEAEARLLSELVVVPLVFPRRADLVGDVKNLGSEEAWKNPAFFGSLRSATR